jgi:hypothetical protein
MKKQGIALFGLFFVLSLGLLALPFAALSEASILRDGLGKCSGVLTGVTATRASLASVVFLASATGVLTLLAFLTFIFSKRVVYEHECCCLPVDKNPGVTSAMTILQYIFGGGSFTVGVMLAAALVTRPVAVASMWIPASGSSSCSYDSTRFHRLVAYGWAELAGQLLVAGLGHYAISSKRRM